MEVLRPHNMLPFHDCGFYIKKGASRRRIKSLRKTRMSICKTHFMVWKQKAQTSPNGYPVKQFSHLMKRPVCCFFVRIIFRLDRGFCQFLCLEQATYMETNGHRSFRMLDMLCMNVLDLAFWNLERTCLQIGSV